MEIDIVMADAFSAEVCKHGSGVACRNLEQAGT